MIFRKGVGFETPNTRLSFGNRYVSLFLTLRNRGLPIPCDSRPKCLRRLQIHLLTYLLTYLFWCICSRDGATVNQCLATTNWFVWSALAEVCILWVLSGFKQFYFICSTYVTGGKSGVGLYDYYLLVDGVSGLERLDALEGLSVITDDQMSVGTNSTSELLVVSSSAAGSLSPSNVIRGQEPHDASVQSTSPLHSQMYAILHYILSLIMWLPTLFIEQKGYSLFTNVLYLSFNVSFLAHDNRIT